jgi:hypothetical protein
MAVSIRALPLEMEHVLKPPNSHETGERIALFQDRVSCPGCSNKINGGSTSNITGAIYFPTNAIEYTGGSATGGAVCTQLIAYTITFKGNSSFNSNCNSAGTKTIDMTNGTLVQ